MGQKRMPAGKKQRVLITGGSGLLALNWACAIRGEHDVVLATHRHRVSLANTTAVPMALDQTGYLTEQFRRHAPDIIVHAAGITSVEQCELEPVLAREINALLARNVAESASRIGAKLIHISTDHLFAGTRAGHTENDAPEPLNVYAKTKLLAEQWVETAHPGALIVRTNFFGWGHRHRQSFSDWIIRGLGRGEALTLFEDAYFTPILADRLTAVVHRLVALGAFGVYNVVGDERVSRHEFGLRLARRFALPEALIRRGRISQANLTARRPSDMSLDNTKARSAIGAGMGTLEDYFDDLRHQQISGRDMELLDAVTAG